MTTSTRIGAAATVTASLGVHQPKPAETAAAEADQLAAPQAVAVVQRDLVSVQLSQLNTMLISLGQRNPRPAGHSRPQVVESATRSSSMDFYA